MALEAKLWDVLLSSSSNLPGAGGYVEDSVIFADSIFHPVLCNTQYTLLELKVFVLSKMYMSAIPANQIRSVVIMIRSFSLTSRVYSVRHERQDCLCHVSL